MRAAQLLLPAFLLLLPVPAAAKIACDPPPARGDGWEAAAPGDVGIDGAALCHAIASAVGSGVNLHGVVVARSGRLVAEVYRSAPDRPIDVLYGLWNPFAREVEFGPATLHDVRSISKSVVGLLVGIALAEGRIPSLATPALALVPELAELRSPERDAITVEHLLGMSSGLLWDESGFPDDETRLYWKGDPDAFVLGRPFAAKPGAVWNYNGGGTAVLAGILTRATGEPLPDLARRALFDPLGITDWEWATDPRGRPLSFTGLRMRPRDLAKLGRMLLDGGEWQGRRIVPESWIAEATRPRLPTGRRSPPEAGELHYGLAFWTGTVAWQGRELPWSAGFGNGGQRLFLVPELDIAVVVAAGDYGSREAAHAVNRLFAQVVASVVDDANR